MTTYPRNDRIADLHPMMRGPVLQLLDNLDDAYRIGLCRTHFKFFEGYRTPERQDYIFRELKTTKAKAWQSPHQYGLAADIVPWLSTKIGGWDWGAEHDYRYLKHQAEARGLLVPISWDLCHVQHPAFKVLADRI